VAAGGEDVGSVAIGRAHRGSLSRSSWHSRLTRAALIRAQPAPANRCAPTAALTIPLVTLYLQGVLGCSAPLARLVGMRFAIASAVSAQQSGRLVAADGRRIVVVGLLLVVAGLVGTEVAIRALGADRVGWVVAGTLMVSGAGSMLQVGQRIDSAIGIAVALGINYPTLAGGGTDARARRGPAEAGTYRRRQRRIGTPRCRVLPGARCEREVR